MTRMTGPDCAVMCNLINIHTYIHTYITYTYIHTCRVFVKSIIDSSREDQCEWHRMTRMTGPDCAVMCNSINIHIHWEDQCEWHRMTRMTGPDCAVMCNLKHLHNTYIHYTQIHTYLILVVF